MGSSPRFSASSLFMSTLADAPSLSWLALPALIILPGPRTGSSLARPSRVVSGRLPSSLSSLISRFETSPVSLSLMAMVAALTADVVPLADDLGGVDHRHVNTVMHAEQLGVRAEAELAGLDEADAFDPAGDYPLHAVDNDLLGGGRDRHQARGALPVDRHASDSHREASAQRGGPPDSGLHALL